MNEGPLISVIVPIYNVEEFLDECVESIVKQTYSNLEIILVDDGSPDNCPSMCDAWLKKDNRIRVIHKKNGGLSSARNAGLEVATGEYMGFVDSDDVIAQNMYELLYKPFLRYENLALTCGMVEAFDEEKRYPYQEEWLYESELETSYNTFFEDVLQMKVCHTAWSKLYRSDVIKRVRFKEGRNNEDTLFLFELSKVIESLRLNMLTIPYYVYFYRMREGSICNNTKVPLFIDVLKNLQEIRQYFISIKDNRSNIVDIQITKTIIMFCIRMLFVPNWKNTYFDEYYSQMCQLKLSDVIDAYINRKNMIIHFLMFKYCPMLYIFLKRWKGF